MQFLIPENILHFVYFNYLLYIVYVYTCMIIYRHSYGHEVSAFVIEDFTVLQVDSSF